MPKPTVSPARVTALQIVEQVFDHEKTLLETLSSIESSCQKKEDRALAREIISGTCRWRGRLQAILERVAKDLEGLPKPVQRILEMSVYQLLYLDRVPSYAIISEAVNLTRRRGYKNQASVVNGVLRNVDRKRESFLDIQGKRWSETLAVQESFPEWMIQDWERLWGRASTEAFCSFSNTVAPLSLRLRREKEALELLQREGISYKQDARIPGRIEIPQGVNFPHAWLRSPLWTVQDGASMLVPMMVAPEPGWKVWDVCAAPGGKSFFLADLMEDQGTIWASDRSRKRLGPLKDRQEHLGLSCIKTREMEVLEDSFPWEREMFDAVLLDVPCTGWGTFRRHPDLRWRLRPGDTKRLGEMGIRMMERVCDYVKVGGRLVYSTCTLSPEENQEVVARFLEKHESFTLESRASCLPTAFGEAFHEEGWIEIFPPRWRMDGMFVACLQKS